MEVVVHHPSGSRGDKEFDAARELRNAVPKKFRQGLGCTLVTLVQGIDNNNERAVGRGWSVKKRFEYKLPELFVKRRGCDARIVLQGGYERLTIGLALDGERSCHTTPYVLRACGASFAEEKAREQTAALVAAMSNRVRKGRLPGSGNRSEEHDLFLPP